jgi:hypothetical protein
MVRLLLLFGPLLSMMSMVAEGSARLRSDRDGDAGNHLTGDAHADLDSHATDHGHAEEDADRGFRAFGRLLEKITILGVLVVALLVVGLILSLAGVFESDVWDPPV